MGTLEAVVVELADATGADATAASASSPSRRIHPSYRRATVIYESRDRGNTWDQTTIELTCSSCRIYSVEQFGL